MWGRIYVNETRIGHGCPFSGDPHVKPDHAQKGRIRSVFGVHFRLATVVPGTTKPDYLMIAAE